MRHDALSYAICTLWNATMQLFLCETPGIWGKLPAGFGHLHETVHAYITLSVPNTKDFVFKKGEIDLLCGDLH
jgi:hypothetical protein